MKGRSIFIVLGIIVVIGVFFIMSNPAANSNVNSLQCSRPCHIDLNNVNTQCVSQIEPLLCTLEYRQSDACLKYLTCTQTSNTCQTIANDSFSQCISCYQSCQGSVLDFEACEQKCNV